VRDSEGWLSNPRPLCRNVQDAVARRVHTHDFWNGQRPDLA
jgi:hypothetical protein